jgi:hypothetical protein
VFGGDDRLRSDSGTNLVEHKGCDTRGVLFSLDALWRKRLRCITLRMLVYHKRYTLIDARFLVSGRVFITCYKVNKATAALCGVNSSGGGVEQTPLVLEWHLGRFRQLGRATFVVTTKVCHRPKAKVVARVAEPLRISLGLRGAALDG